MSMNIEQSFISVLSALGQDTENHNPNPHTIISLMDYTYLDDQPTEKKLQHFQDQLLKYPVAGVCTYPPYLSQLHTPNGIKRVTVVNFPHGQDSLETVHQQVIDVLPLVDEIDYVFPASWIEGNHEREQALLHCQQIYTLCQSHRKTFKAILETGNIQDPAMIYTISRQVIERSGCDFLKTSTGKTPLGATPLAFYAMILAILDAKSSCGIKVSGGIRQIEQAWLYVQLALYCFKKPVDKQWLRIGASSLLDTLSTASTL